jgi:CheY-like chemotaxis protein
LQQVVTNLLTNALKFTPAGGQIAVSLDRAGDEARLVVTDSGSGIPADFLPHVFDRFRQADSTTARRHGGLGLGLAIVKRLVELHDGRVEAASAGPGGGATFTVWLPLAAVEVDTTPRTDVVHTELNGLSVLVVDDHDDSRTLVATILERCGARVVAAATADEALRALASDETDVVLTDIAMPEQDGYSLLERLRMRAPELPAIAVTACVSAEDRTRARRAGFRAHVAKPIDAEELVAAVVAVRRDAV